MRKYGIRTIAGIFVFLFFKLTEEGNASHFFEWNVISVLYMAYTVLSVLILWEVAGFSINHYKGKESFQTNGGFLRVFLKAAFTLLPLVVLFAYVFNFYISPACCGYYPTMCGDYYEGGPIPNMTDSFWTHTAQGFVLSQLIISSDIIQLYIKNAVNTAREKELIQKELIAAKFEGLKNQVNPHFLFNSFSVLTSLIESDSKKASEFLAKLSDMYRYILEKDESAMVPLQEELSFLDDYLFLLKMRHNKGIVVENLIDPKEKTINVPPMSLQILVENAVKHNSFSEEDPLHIQLYCEGNQFIVVENLRRPKKELVRSTGIGLKNLSRRLALSVKRGLEVTEDASEFKVKLPI